MKPHFGGMAGDGDVEKFQGHPVNPKLPKSASGGSGGGGAEEPQGEPTKETIGFHPMSGSDTEVRHGKDICAINDAWCTANCLPTPINAHENPPPVPAAAFRFKQRAEPAAAGAPAGEGAAAVVPPVVVPLTA